MIKGLYYWVSASLVMPVLVFVFQTTLGGLVYLMWPGAIMLMSLGAEARPTSDIIYAWSISVGSNIFLYLLLGVVVQKLFYTKSNEKNRNKALK